MTSSFKKDQNEIRYFNWYWSVINGRRGIRGGICNAIHWFVKDNNKYMKDYDKHKE